MLKNRQDVKDEIIKNMKEQVKGWGVWLETVEITDVQILSTSLFKDLQAKFREEKRRDAQLKTMEIDDEIAAKRIQKELEMKKVTDKYSLELSKYQQNSNIRVQES